MLPVLLLKSSLLHVFDRFLPPESLSAVLLISTPNVFLSAPDAQLSLQSIISEEQRKMESSFFAILSTPNYLCDVSLPWVSPPLRFGRESASSTLRSKNARPQLQFSAQSCVFNLVSPIKQLKSLASRDLEGWRKRSFSIYDRQLKSYSGCSLLSKQEFDTRWGWISHLLVKAINLKKRSRYCGIHHKL